MVRALDDGITTPGAEQRLKVPPHSIEAEQALLGGLMLDHKSWDKIADVVSASDFYRKDHALIFTAIAELAEDANPCDVVTVSEVLDNRSELDDAGGLEYLASLANETPGAANARATTGASMPWECPAISCPPGNRIIRIVRIFTMYWKMSCYRPITRLLINGRRSYLTLLME